MNEPTNGELKIMLDNQNEKFTEKLGDISCKQDEMAKDVKEIVKQTTTTNGKVAKLIWWKNSVIWALSALWALIIIAFPILRWIVHKDIEQTTHDSVSSALSEFNIIVK